MEGGPEEQREEPHVTILNLITLVLVHRQQVMLHSLNRSPSPPNHLLHRGVTVLLSHSAFSGALPLPLPAETTINGSA